MTLGRRQIRGTLTIAIAFAVGLVAADRMMTSRSVAADEAATTAPSTGPTSAPAASRPTIPSDAQAVLDRITAAYAQRPIEVLGTFEQHFDVAGIRQDSSAKITGVARSGSTFRHETEGQVLVVADGTKGHVLDLKQKVFRSADVAESNARPIVSLQNPALAVAVEGDAAKALIPDAATDVRKLDAADAEGQSLVGIGFDVGGTKVEVRVPAEGPATIARVTYDFANYLSSNGAADVKRATAVARYERSGPPGDGANADDRFAFVAPADAREAPSPVAAEAKAANVLDKGPAPAFALKDLEGKEVKLESERGHVLILDFWATWCGPCRESLPHLAKVAREFAGQGVRAYAINAEEQPDVVREYWSQAKLDGVRPLLDLDGSVGGAYGVSGIPHTVVVDAKGQIRSVIVGFNPDGGSEKLSAAVRAALDAR
jgi:thiol-disulfide isomerase/thioredoxin